jgi:hypothetical protein
MPLNPMFAELKAFIGKNVVVKTAYNEICYGLVKPSDIAVLPDYIIIDVGFDWYMDSDYIISIEEWYEQSADTYWNKICEQK